MTLNDMLRESARELVTPPVAPPPFGSLIRQRRQRHRNSIAAIVVASLVVLGGLVVLRAADGEGARITSEPVAPSVRSSGQLVQREFDLERDGFVGRYFAPMSGAGGAAVLVIDGPQGGLGGSSTIAQFLANQGSPAMAVAYHGWPGLPDVGSSIPLEYFVPALESLRAQPEADGDRVAVLGTARGSEAALLLGAHYPDLVSAVAGLSPANVSFCAYQDPDCHGPAWTFAGAPVPYASPRATAPAEAEIPVEEIQGPVFLACGLLDTVWRSCFMARSIEHRLSTRGSTSPVRVIVNSRAGWSIVLPPDASPVKGASEVSMFGGGTYDDNQKAQRSTWAALTRWLRSIA